jgi:hypothetical protein
MGVNLDKPDQWKANIAQSVVMYNDWFMKFAPQVFRTTQSQATNDVESAFHATSNLTNIKPVLLRQRPDVLPTLRMSTCPPLAVDRLIGLAGVSPGLVNCMEDEKKFPLRMPNGHIDYELARIASLIEKMADPVIFVWRGRAQPATDQEIHRATIIVAERLCASVANPIIRNAQEERQLAAIKAWLEARQYTQVPGDDGVRFQQMRPGTFAFRMNVRARRGDKGRFVKIPIDVVVMPKQAPRGSLPILFEAKSAGDFTNPNKRRKEEADKMARLRATYGDDVKFNLFLCGYFDSGYLEYEAAGGIDWVWEHRIDDLAQFGL